MRQLLSILRVTLATAVITLAACAGHSRVVRTYIAAPAVIDQPVGFTLDSIDFRPDLTRVYGRLTGAPHTSHRIDSSALITPGGRLDATDIDGVDFRRYFQWEDEGEIPVEIDYPRATDATAIEMVTVRGKATFNIARKAL